MDLQDALDILRRGPVVAATATCPKVTFAVRRDAVQQLSLRVVVFVVPSSRRRWQVVDDTRHAHQKQKKHEDDVEH